MVHEVRIDRRFNGPPGIANGGYACALVAGAIGGPATVTLRRPVPLDETLRIEEHAGGVRLLHRHELLAEGVAAPLPEPGYPAVDIDTARATAAAYEGQRDDYRRQFPCFVCGADRHAPDGLAVYPGPVPGREVVAAAWVPHDNTTDGDVLVRPEIVWAVLDCAATWGAATGFATPPAMLGRLTAGVVRPPLAGERCVAVGWGTAREGRKLHGGAALYTAGGELLASCDATCILPREG